MAKITDYNKGVYTITDSYGTSEILTANMDDPVTLTRFWTHKIASAKRSITALRKHLGTSNVDAVVELEETKEKLRVAKSIIGLLNMRIEKLSPPPRPKAYATTAEKVRNEIQSIESYNPITDVYDVKVRGIPNPIWIKRNTLLKQASPLTIAMEVFTRRLAYRLGGAALFNK